jgi:hypothetical protein
VWSPVPPKTEGKIHTHLIYIIIIIYPTYHLKSDYFKKYFNWFHWKFYTFLKCVSWTSIKMPFLMMLSSAFMDPVLTTAKIPHSQLHNTLEALPPGLSGLSEFKSSGPKCWASKPCWTVVWEQRKRITIRTFTPHSSPHTKHLQVFTEVKVLIALLPSLCFKLVSPYQFCFLVRAAKKGWQQNTRVITWTWSKTHSSLIQAALFYALLLESSYTLL